MGEGLESEGQEGQEACLSRPSRPRAAAAHFGHQILSSGTPAARASCSTGVGTGVALLPRPLGFPGCDTTATTSKELSGARAAASRSSSTMAATFGVLGSGRLPVRQSPHIAVLL